MTIRLPVLPTEFPSDCIALISLQQCAQPAVLYQHMADRLRGEDRHFLLADTEEITFPCTEQSPYIDRTPYRPFHDHLNSLQHLWTGVKEKIFAKEQIDSRDQQTEFFESSVTQGEIKFFFRKGHGRNGTPFFRIKITIWSKSFNRNVGIGYGEVFSVCHSGKRESIFHCSNKILDQVRLGRAQNLANLPQREEDSFQANELVSEICDYLDNASDRLSSRKRRRDDDQENHHGTKLRAFDDAENDIRLGTTSAFNNNNNNNNIQEPIHQDEPGEVSEPPLPFLPNGKYPGIEHDYIESVSHIKLPFNSEKDRTVHIKGNFQNLCACPGLHSDAILVTTLGKGHLMVVKDIHISSTGEITFQAPDGILPGNYSLRVFVNEHELGRNSKEKEYLELKVVRQQELLHTAVAFSVSSKMKESKKSVRNIHQLPNAASQHPSKPTKNIRELTGDILEQQMENLEPENLNSFLMERNEFGRVPAHYAVIRGRINDLRTLVDRGGLRQLMVIDHFGRRALDYGMILEEERRDELHRFIDETRERYSHIERVDS